VGSIEEATHEGTGLQRKHFDARDQGWTKVVLKPAA
jgi:hypothetical protein